MGWAAAMVVAVMMVIAIWHVGEEGHEEEDSDNDSDEIGLKEKGQG
jgi:hypothetical protein